MTSILDGSLTKIRDAIIPSDDVPALIAAEEAGKTRKSVIDYLKSLLPAEPAESDAVSIEIVREGAFYAPSKRGLVGDVVEADADTAADLIERGYAKRA